MQEYYFDTLPLHPPPEPLESLTSYLIRLAEANGHSDRDTFALFFRPLGVKTLADYPSALFNILQTLARCSEARLLGTTFYHVGRKFGRSSLPQSLAQFLQGTVAQSLRYCPMCLADYGYHFLPWRFLHLKGCDKHCCELLNECGHCGGKMPTFGPVLKMATCPTCKGDLRKCLSSPLDEKEKQRAFLFTQELEFLLSPQPWEDEYTSIAEMVGRELKILRQGQRKTQAKVSQAIGCSKGKLQALEQGFKNKRGYEGNKLIGTSFQWYLKYASYLGIRLEDLFDIAIQYEAHKQQSLMIQKGPLTDEEEVLMKVEKAIQRLNTLELRVTQKSVLKIVGRASGEKFKEQIAAKIRDERLKQAQEKEDKLFTRVQSAVRQLEDLRKPITKRAIADIVGISQSKLERNPKVAELINQKVNFLDYQRRRYQLHEDELLAEVEDAVKKIKDDGKAVTFRAIGEIVGMTPENFKYYPRVRALLEEKSNYLQFRRRSTQLRENELLSKVEAAIQQLEASAQPLTYLAVSKLVGMNPKSLNRYPRIRTLLVQKVNAHHPHRNVRDFNLREDALLAEVKAAINRLEKLGTPVTQRAICEAIGMPAGRLEQYPRIKILLGKYADNYYLQYSIQSRDREDDLLLEVENAVQLLIDFGRPITQRAIGGLLGVPAKALGRYPRLRERIVQQIKVHSSTNETSLPLREEELMEEIVKAKSALDSAGRPATPGAIRKLLGIEPSFLKHYPQVNKFLRNLEKLDVERRRQHHEEELLVQAEAAIQELKNKQQPLTQMNISKSMGCNTGTLRCYPRVLTLVMEHVKQEKQRINRMYHQQKEEKIKEGVLDAVRQLQALDQRITIEAICQIAQLSRGAIAHYPQVNQLLDPLLKRRQNALLQRGS